MFRAVLATCSVLLAGTIGVYSLSGVSDRAYFSYVNRSGINTLDPAAITWNQDIRVALNLWEGLVSYGPDASEPVAGAAYLPEVSDDGLVYRFTIGPDARWSNGDPVTAADFVRGWRRAIEPGTAGDYAFFLTEHVVGAAEYYAWRNAAVGELASLEPGTQAWQTRFDRHATQRDQRFSRVGLQALDARLLQVRLVQPCPYFLDLCAFVTLLPVHESIERLRLDYQGSGLTRRGLVVYDPQWTKPDYHVNGYPGLITNGPYLLKEWRFKRRLRMTANPFFHDRERLGCSTVDMVVYGDLNTAIMAYEAGELDFLPDTSVSYDHELARLAISGERPDFHCAQVFATYYYLFNCADETVGGRRNPFVDVRVRQAFALAVDKELLAQRVSGRGETATDNVVPAGSIKGYASPAGLGHDPEAARRLLAEAGYPGGAGLGAIDLLYNTGSYHGKICDVLATMWGRELGAVVVPRGKEVKTFAEDRKGRRFMIARAGWYGDYADPTTFLDVFATGNGNNDSGHSDATFDALLRRASREHDADARMALLAQAEGRLIRETLPLVPLYRHTQVLAIKPYVRGLRPNPRLMFLFRYVAVDR
ncbi:MAG: peptide ABC transporter substrate-binding protein [Phycisphaerae bacterium]